MGARLRIEIPEAAMVAFCQQHGIARLAFFGSVLRDDFRPDSDVDVLAEFAPGRVPGLIGLAGIELELSELLGGRKVDLNTPGFFAPPLRERIQREAMVRYGAA
jgi:predicted nucleotidyltransferase